MAVSNNGTELEMKSKVENGKVKKKIDEDEEEEDLTTCGLGNWRPKWLQFMAKPEVFFINLVLVGVIQTMGAPIYYSAMSTLEKRYRFDSKISGLIILSDCVVEVAVSLNLHYRVHKN